MEHIEKIQKQIEETRKCLNELVDSGAEWSRILEESQKVDELIVRYYKST